MEIKYKERRVLYVSFNFGSWAYIGVNIYEGKTLNECLKMKSENIDGVLIDGLYIKID